MPFYEHGGNYQYFPPGGLYQQGVEDRGLCGGLPPLGFSSFDHHLQLHHHYEEEQEQEEEEDYDSSHDCNQEVHDCDADDDSIGNIRNASNDSYDKKKKEPTSSTALFRKTVPKKRKVKSSRSPIVLGIGHKAPPASSCFESSASSSSSSIHSGAGASWDQDIEDEDESEDERILQQIKIRKAAIHKNKKKKTLSTLSSMSVPSKKSVPTVLVVAS